MNTKKLVIGTLVAGVVAFLLGWLIYGIALTSYMAENCVNPTARPEAEMVWWALVLSNFVYGLLLAILLDWQKAATWQDGLKVGAILGTLTALGFDLSMYAMTTMFTNITYIIVDSLAFGIMYALTGIITVMAINKIK